MHRVSPAALAGPACADAAVTNGNDGSVAETDVPAIAFGTGASHAEIAAQVADRVITELINQNVGERALRDSTQVERRTRGERRRTRGLSQEEHLREWRELRRKKDGRLRQALPEWPVVSSRGQRRKHRGADEAFAF